MIRIDIDDDAHPGAKRWQTLAGRVDPHAERDSLHDLHPVATGVLRRQERELLRRRWTDALNDAVPIRARVSVDRYGDGLPRPHIRQFRLFRGRVDPDVLRGDEIESGRRGREVFAG